MSTQTKIEVLLSFLTKEPSLKDKVNIFYHRTFTGICFIRVLVGEKIQDIRIKLDNIVGYDIFTHCSESFVCETLSKTLTENLYIKGDPLILHSESEILEEIISCCENFLTHEEFNLAEKQKYIIFKEEKYKRFEKLKSLFEKLTLLFPNIKFVFVPSILEGYVASHVSEIYVIFPKDTEFEYDTRISGLSLYLTSDRFLTYMQEKIEEQFSRCKSNPIRFKYVLKKENSIGFEIQIEKQIFNTVEYDSIEKAIELFTRSILTPEKIFEKEQEKFQKLLDIHTFQFHDDMKTYLRNRWTIC